MDPGKSGRVADIVEHVKGWPPESRALPARRILETPGPATTRPQVRSARSVQELFGIGAGAPPPPDDETAQRWIDEHRSEKYR